MDKEKKKSCRKHTWVLERWITKPKNLKELNEWNTWNYLAEYRCSACGKLERKEPSIEDLKSLKETSCTNCGEFGLIHEHESDCIKVLRLKVEGLEERLESLDDMFDSMRSALRC